MGPKRERLNEIEEDIRSTGEELIGDALEVVRIEKKKIELSPDDPNRAALAQQTEAVAKRMVRTTSIETELVDEAMRVD